MAVSVAPEYIFETSWEVCNMVGGIYTVLSTRAATLQEKHQDKLIFIGPYLNDNPNPYFEEDKELLSDWIVYTFGTYHLKTKVGRWKIPGKPLVVLVDFSPLLIQKNDIYSEIWSQFGVNSLPAYGDYDESSMFGYATGIIIESYYRFFKIKKNQQVIAHFNEWMTTFGAFYIRHHVPEIATVFTTHATSIGRSIAGNHKPLYDYLNEYNGDMMANELNMVSKHSTEKVAAQLVDCFTTVSEITARECSQLLERQPDVVTPNGFEDDFIPKAKAYTSKRKDARQLLSKVAETLMGYELEKDAIFVATAGRYEYKNKGIDTFIEALKHLYEYRDMNRQIVAFIMVPAWVKGPRVDLMHSLNQQENRTTTGDKVCTHELMDYYNDKVMGALHWFHIFNNTNERVKVVFVPSYLNGADGIFNKTYYDLLVGMDLTVFPSYYEPWGYTPLESVAFKIPTITTDLSGFGQWVSSTPQGIETGVGIIHRSDYNNYEVVLKIAEMIYNFSKMNDAEMKNTSKNAAKIAEKALWKHFIVHYENAYQIALINKKKRIVK